jgi:hypothetical protein
MQPFTITKSFQGKYQITIPCPITGTRKTETVGHCTMKHLEIVARSILKNRKSSSQEVAIIAQNRYDKSLRLRAMRMKTKQRKEEVWETIDRGFIPTVQQLRNANMMK